MPSADLDYQKLLGYPIIFSFADKEDNDEDEGDEEGEDDEDNEISEFSLYSQRQLCKYFQKQIKDDVKIHGVKSRECIFEMHLIKR